MALSEQQILPFMEYARERENIRVRRIDQMLPRPWTSDPILAKFRFCNVYREDDATTRWFREYVRDPMQNEPEVLLATVLFRWFNRITTGQAMFLQGSFGGKSAWDVYLEDEDIQTLKSAILSFCGQGPYVTGAYIIKSPDGMNKLDGVLHSVKSFRDSANFVQHIPTGWGPRREQMNWYDLASMITSGRTKCSLEQMWSWLKKSAFLGGFTAYEVVTDLRHTRLLRDAPDIMTWANAGPGAVRGLNRIHGRRLSGSMPPAVTCAEMREILELAQGRYRDVWPTRTEQEVEMRDIEHTLCEFDKYERARLGEGRPRGTLR